MYSGLLAPSHLIILLLIIALLFGAKRLPELGRSLGQGIKEFKEGINTKEEESEENNERPDPIEEGQHDTRGPQEGSQREKEVTHLTGSESPTRR
jgi:sec-independent protein translocase protein TatA